MSEEELVAEVKRLNELDGVLRRLFQELLDAVYPTHTYWCDSNPALVSRIKAAGFDGTREPL